MGPRPNGRGKGRYFYHRHVGRLASMGPRPNGRGKAPACCEFQCPLGVNGAAAKRPRKGHRSRAPASGRPASMGPRPNGRGKYMAACLTAAVVVRQWGRGQTAAESAILRAGDRQVSRRQWGRGQTAAESAGAAVVGCRTFSVNGAAAKRPRKVGNPAAAKARGLSASMGPRPNGRGKFLFDIGGAGGHGRQWGRGQTAAESCHRVFGGREYRASMGPRPNGRGKHGPAAITAGTLTRQWGRGQTAAERRKFRGSLCLVVGASMGPRPNGRGKPPDRMLAARGLTASMGPRPNGRGKRIDSSWLWLGAGVNGAAAKRPRKVGALGGEGYGVERQWGRGQTAAESVPPSILVSTRHSRQWGRGQTAAESRHRRHTPCGPHPASMGPRPNGRGKRPSQSSPTDRPWRQWGRGQTAAES